MFYVPCDVNISVLVSVQLLLLFQQRNDAVINFHYVLIKRWGCDFACPQRPGEYIIILVLRVGTISQLGTARPIYTVASHLAGQHVGLK